MKFHLFLIAIVLTGCGMGAGHGSVQGYIYPVKKSVLQSAINKVIKENPNIYIDTLGFLIISPKIGGGIDSTYDHGYNNGKSYLTTQIKTNKGLCKYTFRFYGGETHWETSVDSQIFICWAHNEEKKGGSEGGGFDKKAMKGLLKLFELELISKLDETLGFGHIKTK